MSQTKELRGPELPKALLSRLLQLEHNRATLVTLLVASLGRGDDPGETVPVWQEAPHKLFSYGQANRVIRYRTNGIWRDIPAFHTYRVHRDLGLLTYRTSPNLLCLVPFESCTEELLTYLGGRGRKSP